jgi:hypothetical protein
MLCCCVVQVWKFESDSTLADALSGNLGQWPEDIEEIMLKRVDESQPVEKREASVSTQLTHMPCFLYTHCVCNIDWMPSC